MPSDGDRDAVDLSKLDQSSAVLGDILPPLWWRLYRNSIEAGFDETEAFSLLKVYIRSQGTPPAE